MDIFPIIIIALFTGMIVKLADNLSELKTKTFETAGIVISVLYGILIVALVSLEPRIAPLWLGIVIAMLFSGKIDTLAHAFGLGTIFLLLLVFGIPTFSIHLFLLFVIVAVLDEYMHDRAGELCHPLKFIAERRLLIEITAFIVSGITGQWILFIAILSFDIGYLLLDKFFSTAMPQEEESGTKKGMKSSSGKKKASK